MTKEEAFQVLTIPTTSTKEEIGAAIESKLFEVKHYLLQMVVVPRLYQSRLRMIKQLNDIAITFDFISGDILENQIKFPSTISSLEDLGLSKECSWGNFLSKYEVLLMQAKGQLSLSINPIDMYNAIVQLIRFQLAFDGLIFEQFSSIPEMMDVDVPRQQDQLGSVAIRKFFGEVHLLDRPITLAFTSEDWNQFNQKSLETFYKEWLRCSKGKDLWK